MHIYNDYKCNEMLLLISMYFNKTRKFFFILSLKFVFWKICLLFAAIEETNKIAFSLDLTKC